MMESPWPHVKEYFARFPKSGFKLKEHTDLVVRSQSDEFYVHKAILAANSKFFANACKPGSPFKEAKTGIISFDDEDSRLIKVLLLSCYRELDWDDIRTLDDLTNENRNEMIRTVQDILNLVAIYRIADKYQVQYLMGETETWISGELVDDYNNDPISHCPPDSWRKWMYLPPSSFVRVAREIFDTIPKGRLHHIPLRYAAKHLTYLNRSQEFKDMMNEIDDFRDELLDHIATITAQRRKCTGCMKTPLISLFEFMVSEDVYSNFHRYYKWQCPECGRENVVEGMNKPSDTKEQEMATESADQPMDDQL